MPSTINASTTSGIIQTADTSGVLNLQAGNTTMLSLTSIGPVLPAGTTTIAPLDFVSGSLLTTAIAGGVEYDGTALYFSPAVSSRAVLNSTYYTVLSSAYTLTSQTAAQKLFNASTNGALTLPVGTYEFECGYSLSSMSSSSGSFGFALGGTATFTQGWYSIAQKGTATLATATATQSTYSTGANTTIATASVNTVGYAFIKGIIRVTVTGTVIPQVSLGVAAAAIVGVNSYFKATPIGSATVTTVGNWS
jgi:hypothetical protein